VFLGFERQNRISVRHTCFGLFFGALLTFHLLLCSTPPRCALAAEEDPNGQCFQCHEDQSLKGESGGSVFVNKGIFDKSIHARSGLNCVSCHTDLENVKDFPHAEKLAKVNCAACHDDAQKKFQVSLHASAKQEPQVREVNCKSCHGYHDVLEKTDLNSKTNPLNLAQTCGNCHFSKVNGKKGEGFVKGYLESVHATAVSRTGLVSSATCVNCHSAHEVRATNDLRSPVFRKQVPYTCGKCHTGILRDYLEGVHGRAFTQGIADVPVCTDCHGEHQIRSPRDKRSAVYATHVAMTCAKCHDNEQLTEKYKLPKGRLRTFQGTFHGLASAYGESRVASCASCHGFHNIRPSSDPKSPINAANLPQTCGKCHGGASAKLSKVKIHVLDTKMTNYAAYVVQGFYVVMIATVIGSFVIYILADLKVRIEQRKRSIVE
jgi:hypothetical protein